MSIVSGRSVFLILSLGIAACRGGGEVATGATPLQQALGIDEVHIDADVNPPDLSATPEDSAVNPPDLSAAPQDSAVNPPDLSDTPDACEGDGECSGATCGCECTAALTAGIPEGKAPPAGSTVTASQDKVACPDKHADCKGGCCWFENQVTMTCDKGIITAFKLDFPKGSTKDACTPDRTNGGGNFLAQDDGGIWYGFRGAPGNPGTVDKPKPLSDIFDLNNIGQPNGTIVLKNGKKVKELRIEVTADLKCTCTKDNNFNTGKMAVSITIKDCKVTIGKP